MCSKKWIEFYPKETFSLLDGSNFENDFFKVQNFLTVIVLLNSVRLEISELVQTGETVASTSVRTNVLIAETPKPFVQLILKFSNIM